LAQPPYTIRGREIGPDDLEIIRSCIREHRRKGRSEISRALCRLWDWKQPNGWLKDRACRDLLLALERHGEIQLPPRKTSGPQGKKHVCTQGYLFLDQRPLEGKDQVINNVPFLILPWVRVKHLASKILAANTKVLREDWAAFYHTPIQLLETFVDLSRFTGTSYRAANWQLPGRDQGLGEEGEPIHLSRAGQGCFRLPVEPSLPGAPP